MNELTEEQRDALMIQGYEDPVFFLSTFLPHLFPKEIPWVHRGLLAIALKKTDFLLKYGELDKILAHFVWREDPNPNVKCKEFPLFIASRDEGGNIIALDLCVSKNVMAMIPRGFSKTTLFGIGVILIEILYKVHDFIVFLSETANHSEMQLTNVKRELETNELIRAVFGNVVPDRMSPLKWTNSLIETTTDVIVIARGRGGQVRGLNHRGKRPNRIIIDDVEDKESVKTEESRKKTRSWFYADVTPALPPIDDEAGIFALGTLLHSESLLMTLAKDPTWTSCRFGAVDKDGEALWSLVMDLGKLEKTRQSFALAGESNAFNMEYMSRISDDKEAKFRKSFFHYVPAVRGDFVGVGLALDPTISEKDTSDMAGIAVVGMRSNGRLNILDLWGKVGSSPREQIDMYFEFNQIWKPTMRGVEANAYQKALIHLMKEEMFRKAKLLGPAAYFEIVPLIHSTAKSARIEGILQPRYAAGYIEHNRTFSDYETQLLDYPNGKDDLPDVVAMAISLLDPYAAAAGAGDKDEDLLSQDEYEDLDEVMGGDWRPH